MKVCETVCNSLYWDLLDIINDEELRKKKEKQFLITGGNGFIAYYIVLSLLCLNDEFDNKNKIWLLVRNRYKAEQKYGQLLNRDDVFLITQDVCDSLSLSNNFDFIIHAASVADSKSFEDNPIGVFNTNVLGTESIIDFIQKKPCISMVYISSFTVYGNVSEEIDISENYRGADEWLSSKSTYPLGKRCAEFLCYNAWRKYGLPIKIVRPGFVYGASTPDDNRVYSEIIKNISARRNIVLRSSGLVYRSMVYVTDVVRGIFVSLFNGVNGEAYNISNEFISIREFAKVAERVSNHNSLLLFENEADKYIQLTHNPVGKMNSQKIMDCGWSPKVPIEKGLEMASEIFSSMF